MTKQMDHSADIKPSCDKDVAGVRDTHAETDKNDAVSSMNKTSEDTENEAPGTAKQAMSEMSQASKMARQENVSVDPELHEFIDSAAEAVLLDTPRSSRVLLWAVFAFLIVIVVWAYFAELDEITRGEGSVIPSQQLQVVQYLEGGIVEEIFVKEGQEVSPGQPLVRVDDTRFLSDFREREQEAAFLKVSVARLRAELKSVDINDEAAPDDWQDNVKVIVTPVEIEADIQEQFPLMVGREQEQLAEYQRNLRNQLSILGRQIDQKEQELRESQSRISHLQRSYNLSLEELKITKPLAEQGIIPRIEVLKLERELNGFKQELEGARLVVPKIQSGIQEAFDKRREVAYAARSESLGKLNEMLAKLNQTKEAQVGLKDRVERTTVVSPVQGTIKTLLVNTLGGVIQPGMDLVEIVPTEDQLLIEAKIAPKDIAFLRPGLKAIVRLTAYDFAIYGGLEGKLEHISADSIEDEKGNIYYLIRIRTENSSLARGKDDLPIIPGMMATVDIMTGKKSVLDYLLKPIFKAQQRALTER